MKLFYVKGQHLFGFAAILFAFICSHASVATNVDFTGAFNVACNDGAKNYVAQFETPPCTAGSISWDVTFPSGAMVTFNQPILSVDWGSGTGQGTIALNIDCLSAPVIKTVNIGVRLDKPASTTGPSGNLANNATYTYGNAAVTDAVDYQWNVPAGFMIDGVNRTWFRTSSLNVDITTPATGTGCGLIRVRAHGDGTDCLKNSFFVEIPISWGLQLVNITGPDLVCESSVVEYSAFNPDATSYSWTLPPLWSFSGSTNSANINAVTSNTGGLVQVQATLCGNFVYTDDLYVSVTSSGDCEGTPLRQGVTLGDGELAQIEAYPNPVTNYLTIVTAAEAQFTEVTFFNQLQQQVSQTVLVNGQARVDLRGLENGIYYMQLSGANGFETKRIIVQN